MSQAGSRFRTSAYLIAVVAYCLLFSQHDPFSQLYVSAILGLDRAMVERTLHWGSLLFGFSVFVPLLWFRRAEWKHLLGEGAVLAGLLWASNSFLICTNVERIHYPQYAILGLLVRGIVQGDVWALLACNLVGMTDELLQYSLYPLHTKYLDFNDMILNMVGAQAGIGLWNWLAISPATDGGTWKKRSRAGLVAAYGALGAAAAWGMATGRIIALRVVTSIPDTVFVETGGKLAFVLSYEDTSAFYLVTGLGRNYHVMGPTLWIGCVLGLLSIAVALERMRPESRLSATSGS